MMPQEEKGMAEVSKEPGVETAIITAVLLPAWGSALGRLSEGQGPSMA